MAQLRLGCSGELQHAVGTHAGVKGLDIEHRQMAAGQRAGFVKRNATQRGELLDVVAALNHDALARRARHAGQNAGGRGHPDAGAVVHNGHGHKAVHIAGERQHGHVHAQERCDQAVGKLLGVVLNAGLAHGRGLNHLHDFGHHRGSSHLGNLHRDRAFDNGRTRKHHVTHTPRGGHRFTGDVALVHGRHAAHNHAVGRHQITGQHQRHLLA